MKSIPLKSDVVVIGGGPSGSTAANALAQAGYDVVLLEKAKHPREVVGESILPFVWKYTDLLGATKALQKMRFMEKSGGTTFWNNQLTQMTFRDFDFQTPALHVERNIFDDILLRTAEQKGARIFEEVIVKDLQLNGYDNQDVFYFDTLNGKSGKISCRYLVDASGQAALVAKKLGFREYDKDLRFMSIWGYFKESDYVALGGDVLPFSQRYETPPTTGIYQIGEWGWCWQIVQNDQVSVGLVLSPEQFSEFKLQDGNLEERFLSACRKVPLLSDMLKYDTLIPGSVRAIRDFAYYPRELAGKGWFLTGDAAAFVDPINSAGVLGGFYTGYMAAMAIDDSLKNNKNRDYAVERFSELLRGRMAVYRLSALPVGVNSYQEMYPYALSCLKQMSDLEKELIYTQMILINRTENLDIIYQLDPDFRRLTSKKYTLLDELHFPASSPVV